MSYRTKNHVQRHRNIKIEGIIIAYAGHEKHRHQNCVVAEANAQLFRAAFRGEQESLQCDESELQKCDQIARSRIRSVELEANIGIMHGSIGRRWLWEFLSRY